MERDPPDEETPAPAVGASPVHPSPDGAADLRLGGVFRHRLERGAEHDQTHDEQQHADPPFDHGRSEPLLNDRAELPADQNARDGEQDDPSDLGE